MKIKYKYFGKHIDPACDYCLRGKRTADNLMILCKKKGVISPFYCCRKFIYDPLMRTPKRAPALPKYTQEDFKL